VNRKKASQHFNISELKFYGSRARSKNVRFQALRPKKSSKNEYGKD
jgi:hypothetical protein